MEDTINVHFIQVINIAVCLFLFLRPIIQFYSAFHDSLFFICNMIYQDNWLDGLVKLHIWIYVSSFLPQTCIAVGDNEAGIRTSRFTHQVPEVVLKFLFTDVQFHAKIFSIVQPYSIPSTVISGWHLGVLSTIIHHFSLKNCKRVTLFMKSFCAFIIFPYQKIATSCISNNITILFIACIHMDFCWIHPTSFE